MPTKKTHNQANLVRKFSFLFPCLDVNTLSNPNGARPQPVTWTLCDFHHKCICWNINSVCWTKENIEMFKKRKTHIHLHPPRHNDAPVSVVTRTILLIISAIVILIHPSAVSMVITTRCWAQTHTCRVICQKKESGMVIYLFIIINKKKHRQQAYFFLS